MLWKLFLSEVYRLDVLSYFLPFDYQDYALHVPKAGDWRPTTNFKMLVKFDAPSMVKIPYRVLPSRVMADVSSSGTVPHV